MILREFFRRKLFEGGNLEVDGQQAQQIDLKVHNRAYITPILNTLLNAINNEFAQSQGGPLWNPKVLKSRKYLSGSSLHFFDTNIPDEEFERVKPKVGDIDTQVNKEIEPQLAQWLDSVKGSVVGNAKFLGYSRGNEQYSSLWELTDPPIKVQIDLEFVDYGENDEPTDWASFSHSSSWDDLSQGIKGVFHKFLINGFTRLTTKEFLLRKMVGRGKARVEQDVPTTDNMFSFAVSSKEGGGLRPKYEPVLDEKGQPLEIDGMSVMRALPTSGYEKDLSKIFQSIFGERIDNGTLKKLLPKTWSYTGLLEIMNLVLEQDEKEKIFDAFVDKLFAPGAQGLYKGDPQRDMTEKNTALNYAIKILQISPPKNLEQMRQDYVQNYKVTTEGPVGLDNPIEEAEEEKPAVQAQLRKGMPHLRDLKPADFLDLVDELRSGGGRFKLENIPLNVKVDGFGGRFGKNAEGKPFMGTSRTEPRYSAGFLKYHQQKGTDDPEILARAEKFDQLFDQMMDAVNVVDSQLGEDFLIDKQVTCEVLFLPFATQTDEGKLKFVGIEYDNLPQGVDLVLVPYKIVQASTGEDIPNGDQIAQQIAELGQSGNVMFMSNRLVQKDGLDVTEIINPLDNLDELKQIVSDTAGKRDRASIQLRREVEAKLKPVQVALEKAIDEDPNIIGKDMLGQEYEGIVINSRLGPIKVTSQRQKDIIAQKNAAKAAARSDQGRDNQNKTAVVAVGSFIGHKGHEELFNFTIDKAKELGGDPYLFIGNAEGKDDPIPPAVKVQTWHKLYPQYAKNISTVIEGGSLIQKIKHELINPLPGKPPRYDNIVIMVGEDRQGMTMPQALMKAVNKFQGYEHVKVSLEATPRGTGISGTMLRNSLKNDPPEKALATWSNAFDANKLGEDWIKHLMDITRKGMGITPQPTTQQPAQTPVPVSEMRLFNALVRPIKETDEKHYHGWEEYEEDKSAQVAEFLYDMNPSLFSRYGDEFVMNVIEKTCRANPKASVTQCAGDVIRHLKKEIDEARMSAAVKLQRAMDRERTKSDASRRRGEEVMAQARSDWEKKQAAEKNKEINEDVKLAGLTTAVSDPENPKIRDDDSYQYFSPDEFFAKFPQFNRQEWEQALDKQKEKSKAYADLRKRQTATNISGVPTTPDEAEKEKQFLLKVLSPEQQAEYKKLYTAGDRDSMFKAGRLLKQAWGSKVKQDEMKKLVKVHWTGVKDLQKFLSGGMSNKTEISAVMYKSKDEIPNKPSWTGGSSETIGLIIDGWTTIAGGMDLASDNQRVGKGEVGKTRSDQKYSFMPARIETDPSKMRTTKAELGSDGWNEATVDNWRVVGIVLPDGVSQSTVDAVNATKLPITDVRTQQQAVGEDAESVDREFALVKKLGRLGQRIVQNPKLWEKYTDAIDSNNLDWIVSLIQEGTGADKNELMHLGDLFGEIGGGTGRIVDFAWAVKEGTWEEDFMNPYKQHRSQNVSEKMLPKSAFAGSDKNKLGPAGQWKNTGPSKNRPARQGDLVGGAAESIDGTDGGDTNDLFGSKTLDKLSVEDLKNAVDADPRNQPDIVARKFVGREGNTWKYQVKLGDGPIENLFVINEYGTIEAWIEDSGDVDLTEKIKGVDGKACWKGKRYAGKVKKADGTYKDKCVPVREDIENIFDVLINKIIVNEAIQNHKR